MASILDPSSSSKSANLSTPNQTQQNIKILKPQQHQLQQWLNQVNAKLFEVETAYLDDTPLGNLVRGWDADGKTAAPSYRSKNNIDERERLFSFSSQVFATDKRAAMEKGIGTQGKLAINPSGTTASNKGRKRKHRTSNKHEPEDWNAYEDY